MPRKFLGPRPAVIAREVTKIHEEFLRGPLAEFAGIRAQTRPPVGEITLLIGPGDPQAQQVELSVSLKERVEQLEAEGGIDRKSGPQTSSTRTRAGQARGVQTTVAGTLEFCSENIRREKNGGI